ncbi:MAG: helix-turn-helix transcriptional regulator [Candidatus Melainabacteria bacterium]|jgi:transcriptional regulator with XRE-family HTH domain|nr:helix-turn-helix transcriptional regulator [Candidatus Melainabacteria bacterium]
MITEYDENAISAQQLLKQLGMEAPLTIGEIIRTFRQSEEITQKVLANTVGISVQRLNDYEHNRRFPSITTAYQLATAIGFSPNILLKMVVEEQLKRTGCQNLNFQVTVTPNWV